MIVQGYFDFEVAPISTTGIKLVFQHKCEVVSTQGCPQALNNKLWRWCVCHKELYTHIRHTFSIFSTTHVRHGTWLYPLLETNKVLKIFVNVIMWKDAVLTSNCFGSQQLCVNYRAMASVSISHFQHYLWTHVSVTVKHEKLLTSQDVVAGTPHFSVSPTYYRVNEKALYQRKSSFSNGCVFYGGPEVQKTCWNLSLTKFHLIRHLQKWSLWYYLRSPGAVTNHSVICPMQSLITLCSHRAAPCSHQSALCCYRSLGVVTALPCAVTDHSVWSPITWCGHQSALHGHWSLYAVTDHSLHSPTCRADQ